MGGEVLHIVIQGPRLMPSVAPSPSPWSPLDVLPPGSKQGKEVWEELFLASRPWLGSPANSVLHPSWGMKVHQQQFSFDQVARGLWFLRGTVC